MKGLDRFMSGMQVIWFLAVGRLRLSDVLPWPSTGQSNINELLQNGSKAHTDIQWRIFSSGRFSVHMLMPLFVFTFKCLSNFFRRDLAMHKCQRGKEREALKRNPHLRPAICYRSWRTREEARRDQSPLFVFTVCLSECIYYQQLAITSG